MTDEKIDHPRHYNVHPSGIECIDVVEHMGFNTGNAIKYIWRAGEKEDALTDLRKARWYIDREIARLGAQEKMPPPVDLNQPPHPTCVEVTTQVEAIGGIRRFVCGRGCPPAPTIAYQIGETE